MNAPAVETQPAETGQAEATPQVEPQSQPEPQAQPEGPKYQPDSGVPAELANGVPQEPNNVEKVDTDGKLASSIDGKVPEGLNSKEEWLHTLLQKEKENPGIVFSEDEQDIYDEYLEGRLEPKTPKPKEETTSEEPKADGDEPKEKEPKEEDNSLESVLKEVGAKSEKELLKKVKDLRKVVSGKVKDSDEYKQLATQSNDILSRFQNEIALMEDVRAGVPEAIQHLESTYGIQVAKPGKTETKKEVSQEEDTPIDTDDYLDEVAGKKIAKLEKMVSDLTSQLDNIQGSHAKIQEKFAGERAEAAIIDEMVAVAEKVPVLKEIQNLRGAIKNWREGKKDERLDGFQHLFDVANKHGVDLITAHLIIAGENSSYEIEKAKRQAKEEVYNQKPTKSLSSLQGRGVDSQPSYTDQQVEEMINSGNMPEDWFDVNDQPNFKTIPKNALKYFFNSQELANFR